MKVLADWRNGVNERVDLSKTYPVDAPATFQRGGHGLFGTTEDYFRFAQMLCNGGVFEGRRIIGRKTLDLMHTNLLPLSLLPMQLDGLPTPGYGQGLGSRVCSTWRRPANPVRSASSAGRAPPRPTTGSIRSNRSSGCS